MLSKSLLLFLLFPTVAWAQPKIPRIGIVIAEMDRSQSQIIKGLRDGLNQAGYQERKNIVLETRNAKGDRSALQPAVAALVAQKAAVIFTTGTRATQAAKSAAMDTPIVFIHPADPIALGLAKSMEQPGGNITGVAGLASRMIDKRMAVLKQIMPELRRVVIFYDSNNKFSTAQFSIAQTAAKKLALEVLEYGIKSAEELKSTIAKLKIQRGDAFFHVPDDLVESEADFVFDTAREKKLPTMFNEEIWAIRGAMAAFGPSYYQMGRQSAHLVDLIIKGRKPETLPIERAEKFDLTLNYRTATFINRKFSADLLKQADKVIR